MDNYQVVFPTQNQVELQPCPEVSPAAGEILLKTIISQISIGTELTYLQGNVEPGMLWENFLNYPKCPGYSNVSRVVAVGEGVSSELIGKLVFSSLTHRMYSVVKEGDFEKYRYIPEGVTPKEAVFSTIGRIAMASIRMAQIRPGDLCVVFGAGIVGQMVARLAMVAGAAKVIVSDISDLRLSKLPQQAGFIPVNTTNRSIAEVIRQENGGRLADIVFETTSVPSLVQSQIECLEKFGKLVVTSSPKGRSLVDLDYCNHRCITIMGVHNVTYHSLAKNPGNIWSQLEDSALIMELLRQKRISTEEMTTHEFNYRDAAAAYEMLVKDRTQALGVNLVWEDAQ